MYNILYINAIVDNIFDIELLFENKIDKYNLLLASNEKEALNFLNNDEIDLVLLDGNDFEIVKLLKKNFTDNIAVIFLIDKEHKEQIASAFKYGIDYVLKPLEEDVFLTRITSHLEVVELKNQTKKEEKYTQSILDLQENIIMIHNTYELVEVNKSFYSFFNVDSIDEFNKTYGSIASQFMEYENYFSLNKLNNNKSWLCELSDKDNPPYSILLLNHNTFEPETFVISVNIIENSDKFVVTLTNVTSIITQSKEYEIKATYDVLTNIYNRNKFDESLKEHHNLFVRYSGDLCLAIFDIDFFKKVNDEHGHIIGDKTLITFAQTIQNHVRNTDVFARWGGEEFTLLLPCTKLENALIAVDKLRLAIENTKFETVGQKTCSIGLTQFRLNDTIDTALLRADEALYEAKETGRNKVCSK